MKRIILTVLLGLFACSDDPPPVEINQAPKKRVKWTVNIEFQGSVEDSTFYFGEEFFDVPRAVFKIGGLVRASEIRFNYLGTDRDSVIYKLLPDGNVESTRVKGDTSFTINFQSPYGRASEHGEIQFEFVRQP